MIQPTTEDVEAVARALEELMGPVAGSPEYLADPVKLARAEGRRSSAALFQAKTAITALIALGFTRIPPGCVVVPTHGAEPNPEWEAKARTLHEKTVAAERADPDRDPPNLEESVRLLRNWLSDAPPANEHGQVSFLRALVEAHLSVCDELITAAPPTA